MPHANERKDPKISMQKHNMRKRHRKTDQNYQWKPRSNEGTGYKRKPHISVKHGSMVRKHGNPTAERPKPKHHNLSADGVTNVAPQPLRNRLDAETLQYFEEISSLLSSGSQLDSEERATLVDNALEETYGKECELACEKSCSRVLEMLIVSSNATQIASLLHRLSPSFLLVSNDAAGSHVVEALLKSAAIVLHDYDAEAAWFKTFKQAFTIICQGLDERITDIVTSCYGSHVVRSLLSVLSGVPFESSHKGRGGGGLSGRLSVVQYPLDILKQCDVIFPHLLHQLIARILEAVGKNTVQLCKDPFASPVLQTMLKILAGDVGTLTKALYVLLGCNKEIVKKEETSEQGQLGNLRQLMLDSSGSHLVEVMLEVAPDGIYSEMFQQILSPHLLEYALHQSANFVVQALIVSLRNHHQVDVLLAELKLEFWSLIKGGRSGIITSILKACRKFQSNEQEVCRSLTKALTLEAASPSCLVPRLLFLENYGRSNGSKNWMPAFGGKMSVLGCAILQLVFSYPEECNQQFWLSLAGMEPADIVATIKDPGGCHVIESFLSSNAPSKQKYRFIARLKGHFAELASRTHSSFTLEKCFSVGKIDMKEAIASELVAIQTDLAKSKHGPNLIGKFDLTGYAKMPDHWRTRMVAKEGTMKAFADVFDINKDSTQRLQKGKRKAVELESNRELTKQGKIKKKKKKKKAKYELP